MELQNLQGIDCTLSRCCHARWTGLVGRAGSGLFVRPNPCHLCKFGSPMPQEKLAVMMAAIMEDQEMLAATVAAVEVAVPEECCCHPWSARR